jgi:hypothetical protein
MRDCRTRDIILARRNKFLAAAMACAGVTAMVAGSSDCCPLKPCLSIAVDPDSGPPPGPCLSVAREPIRIIKDLDSGVGLNRDS